LTESDRHLLTAASVIRREFATAAVAAALEIDVDQVEIACARLARPRSIGVTARPNLNQCFGAMSPLFGDRCSA